MSGKDLKILLKAYRDKDDVSFRCAALNIIEEEENKHHTALARDLRRILTSSNQTNANTFLLTPSEPPKSKSGEYDFAYITRPTLTFNDLVLSENTLTLAENIIIEVSKWPVLGSFNIPRRQKLLFEGPPGTGKTSFAKALASQLHRELAIVRLDTLVSSYLGETSMNLKKVFDFAMEQPFVILFDECDALTTARETHNDNGEMKRVVNAFLQLIDNYQGDSIICAATNYANNIDAALWRRFDEIITFHLPTEREIRELLNKRLKNISHENIDIETYVNGLHGFPHAAVDKFVISAQRNAILHDKEYVNKYYFGESLQLIHSRRW